MLVFTLFIAGCGTKQAQDDTAAPAPPQVGIMDMNKVVKAHPKYNELMTLGQQVDTIAGQLEAQQEATARRIIPGASTSPDISEQQVAELNKASEQEFSTKMSAKQDQLNPQLAAKAEVIRQTLNDELKTYNDQVDKEYEPQIFNLQLKLKTMQLTKEETAALQADVAKIQTQRSAALQAKRDALAGRMDELMAPEKAAVQQQLATYAKQLNEEISKEAAGKQAELASSTPEQPIPTPGPQADPAISQIQEQLATKKQEFAALQALIIKDITEKAASVATTNGFDAVLINVDVNVSAVDITTQVIAECNK